jgi:hypothetical protein
MQRMLLRVNHSMTDARGCGKRKLTDLGAEFLSLNLTFKACRVWCSSVKLFVIGGDFQW